MKLKIWICLVAVLLTSISYIATAQAKDSPFNASEKKQLEAVFDSMVNSYLPAFGNGKVPNTSLIRFGVQHNIRNNQNVFQPTAKGSELFKLASKHVEAAALKSFGKKISKHQSIDESNYRSGYYTVSLNEAEGDLACDITRVIDYGKSTYKVFFDVNDDWADTRERVAKKSVVLRKTGQNGFTVAAYGDAK